MATFFLWIILFIICWPVAIIALFVYPLVWLLLLPFRLLGFAVGTVLDLVVSIIKLPIRILKGSSAVR
ncbi:MAG: hypothetical protein JEY94_12460 [Melioribacteraceae bacterium]|nr:hypothetical protein [Melioribacteraceae bacterium]